MRRSAALLLMSLAAFSESAATAQNGTINSFVFEAPEASRTKSEMLAALEAFGEAAAIVNKRCPARFDAAKQSVIDAMNSAPERRAMPTIQSPAGADMGEYFDILADALAATREMPPRRVMWLWIDALGRAVDEHSGFRFANVPRSGPASAPLSLVAQANGVFVQLVEAPDIGEATGLRAGDQIISIDDVQIARMHLNDVEALLSGADKSVVQIDVLREEKSLRFSVSRQLRDFDFHARVQDDIGVITISSFPDNAAANMLDAVAKIRSEKPDVAGYVLDLRQNSGGKLESIVRAADALLESGPMFSTTAALGCGLEGKTTDTRHTAMPGDVADGAPIAILIGPNTSNGAEAFVAALVERDRAWSVGHKTAGEGRVQTIVPLEGWPGATFRLTTSEFVTPSGGRIDNGGLLPNIEVGPDEDAFTKAMAMLQR